MARRRGLSDVASTGGYKPKPAPKPRRRTGGQLVPSTRNPFDITPPTGAQKIGRHVITTQRRAQAANTHLASGAYSQRTLNQLSRSPEGRAHLRQRAYALARQQLNPGDIRAAARQQAELDKIHEAGIVIPGINAPGNSIATRMVTDLIDSGLGTPYGAYLAVRHPVGSAEALVHEFGRYRHPLRALKQHPGLGLVDAFALTSAGLGTGAKLGAVGSALGRGELGAAGRALIRTPAPPLRKITHEGESLMVEPSRNAAVRAYHRVRGTEVSDRAFNRALTQRQRTTANYARGPHLAVEAKGKHLTPGEDWAVRAEREQIHPADMVRLYNRRAAEETGRYRRRLLKRRDEWKQAEKHVTVRDGQLELTDPKLQEIAQLGARTGSRREHILTSRDLKPAQQLELRKSGPRQVVARYLGGLKYDLGEPRGYVSHQPELKTALPGVPRSPVGSNIGSRPPTVGNKEFQGGAILSGQVPKTTRAMARSGLEAEKVNTWFDTFDRLRAAGKDAADPAIQKAYQDRTLNRKYVALVPVKKLSVEQRQALNQLRVGAGEDATPVLQKARQRFIVGDLGSKVHSDPHAADAAAALDEAGVKFVPRSRARALRPEIAGAPSTALKRTVDTINQATVSAYLYLGSKYVVTNTPGQVWMTMTQGSLNPLNIRDAAVWHHRLHADHPDLFYGSKEALGGGMARSLVERHTARNPVMRGSNIVSRLAGKLIDDPYRWNSFVYHAKRRGFRSYDDVVRLLKADSGKLADERAVIFEAANRDMVDYERLSPVEKEIVRRVILFYPWIKGSTYFAGRWVREHPVQASVQLHLGNAARERQQQQLGDRPQFAQQIFPFGNENIPGLGNVPTVIDPSSAGIITQLPQIGQSVINTIEGKGGVQLGEMASPVLQLIAAALRYNLAKGESMPGDILQRLQAASVGSVPLASLLRVGQRQGRSRIEYTTKSGQTRQYMYPRSGFEQFMRSVVAGGLYPTPVNLRSMHHTARLEGGKSSKNKQKNGWSWNNGGGGGSSKPSSGWTWSK